MRKRPITLVGALAIISMILFSSCGKNGSPIDPDPDPTMQKETRSGTLIITQGSTLQAEDLEVVTFATSADLDTNGEFSVKANEAEKYQLLFFRSKTSRNPVYLGLYNPLTNTISANDTSTALALALLNPYLCYTDQTQRVEYLEAIKLNSRFTELLSLLRNAYQTDANTALNYEVNPTIYETAVYLMKETMENLGGGGGLIRNAKVIGDPPYIEDAPDADILFVNPRHIWYGAGIYPNAGSLSDVVTVNRKVTILSFNWGWPPVVVTEPAETTCDLGNGYFKLYLHKGGEFSKITQWNDPSGRATVLNTGQAILYIAELIIGYLPLPPLAELPNHIVISPERALELSSDIAQKNPEGFLIHFASLIADNSESIAYWIWQETQEDAAHEFLSAAAGIVENVTFVFKLLGFVNEEGPFVWDLVFAPRDVTYFVTQENGIITSMEENNSPNTPSVPSGSSSGNVNTNYTFYSSAVDLDGDPVRIRFFWADGDTSAWSSEVSSGSAVSMPHSWSIAGTYYVKAQAKDTHGTYSDWSSGHRIALNGGGDFEWCDVPAGPYIWGENDETKYINYDYQIMKYEVTNAQYVAYLEEALATGVITVTASTVQGYYTGDNHWGASNYAFLDHADGYCRINWDGSSFSVVSGYEDHAVVEVSWFGAWAFSEHYSFRLPDEYEWEKAARGMSRADYPWGETWGDDISDNANYRNSGDPWDNGTTPVGLYNGQNYLGFQTIDSPSPYGTYDMAGNVWEWTHSWMDEGSSDRVFRGGSWYDGSVGLQSWHRHPCDPGGGYYGNIGFRSVKIQ